MRAVTLPDGTVAGLETPLLMLAVPVVAAVLYALVFLRAGGAAGSRSRRWLFASRLLVVALLVIAAAGPYTVATAETRGDPSVRLLVDRSESMNVTEPVVEDLASDIEATGVPVTVSTIASGTDSRIGDGVAANLRENGSVVLVSDGQVTGGQSLGEAANLAGEINASISTVSAPPVRTERHVTIDGPETVSAGVENRFVVRVGGVETTSDVAVSVAVDGTEVDSERLDEGTVEVTHEFETPGPHRVTARLDGDDRFDANDVYRKTVRVVEPPKILYVSRGDYPFERYLSGLYDVDTAESLPEDLDEYYAVVLQDMAAADMGDLGALQEFVIDGNGLFVVGGDNAFEQGGYESSPLAPMLPVTVGESGVGTTTVVMAIDVSGSAQEGMQVQKAIALDALSQLGDGNAVGIVGFNWRAYNVAGVQELTDSRMDLRHSIQRLQSGGGTELADGLRGAEEMLGDRQGSIVLITDGQDDNPEVLAVAERLGREGIRVVTIGSGPNPNEELLRRVAARSGGTYFRADQTNRLKLLFGGGSREFTGDGLTVVDEDAFVTSGVELAANPDRINDVSVRAGADFLVATEDGTPAVASWRYGLGRVVTLSTYAADGSLGGLLQAPDSLLLTRAVNYAVGDPERKASGVTSIPDTRVGEPTTVTYRGESRPSVGNLAFRAAEPGVYRADVTPTEAGYHEAVNATYAANYPAEYGGFGPDGALESAVESTDGREFAADESAAIAEFARQAAIGVRDVRQSWDWLGYLLALLALLVEVVVRRVQVYNGRTRHESGLP